MSDDTNNVISLTTPTGELVKYREVQKPERRVFAHVSSTEFQAMAAAEGINELDSLIAERVKYEPDHLSFLTIRYAARRMLPYGRWTLDDGREVIFNREYQPIYSCMPGEPSVFCNHADFIDDIAKVEYFYDDYNSPVRYLTRKCKPWTLDAAESRACRNSLAICLRVMKEREPRRENFKRTGPVWTDFSRTV